MERNIGYPKRRDKNPLVEITRGNNSEHTSNIKTSGSSTSKENFPPKKLTAATTHSLISPAITKIVFPIEKLQKKYKLKEMPEEVENLNMPDSDDELSFYKSARVKDQKKSSCSTTTREQFDRSSLKRPLEGKKRDSQTTFRMPSPIAFSQPIENDSTEYITQKSTKFQRPSPIRSFGQDNHGLVEASPHKSDTFRIPSPIRSFGQYNHETSPRKSDTFRIPSPVRSFGKYNNESVEVSPRKSDTFRIPSPIRSFGQYNHGLAEIPLRKSNTFRIPSPISISKNEPKVQSQLQSSSRTSQFTESSIITRKKRVIKIIDDDDDEFNLTSRSNIKSNIMDKDRYNKNSICAKNSNGTTSSFTNSKETVSSKVELKTKSVQSSLIDDFYEPGKKRGSFKRSQKNNGIPLSKNTNEKTGVKDKKSVKVMSRNEKEKDSGVVKKRSLNKSSRRISSDDDFVNISPHKPKSPKKKKNDVRARVTQSNSDDSDFVNKSPRKSNPKKSSPRKKKDVSHQKKSNTLRRKPNLSDDDFMDISPQNTEDESETLNRFRAPSPTRNKYADLPEMDLLSEEEIPIQSNSSRKRREGSAEYKHCPFCKEPIPFPLPERIRAYLIKINPSARDKLSNQTQMPSPSILLQHSLNIIDQFEFCRLHDAETHIVPEGLKKNYPINIDFDSLPKRVEKLIPELMLVIKGKRKSFYRDVALNAYQELGRARARKPTILMGRFQKFQPGYYGSKGASIIFSSLVSLFLDTNILTMDMTKPQEPLEYLNQVLVPETAIMLISHDRGGISFEEARKTMEDSLEFGMYVHDIDEELDDE